MFATGVCFRHVRIQGLTQCHSLFTTDIFSVYEVSHFIGNYVVMEKIIALGRIKNRI